MPPSNQEGGATAFAQALRKLRKESDHQQLQRIISQRGLDGHSSSSSAFQLNQEGWTELLELLADVAGSKLDPESNKLALDAAQHAVSIGDLPEFHVRSICAMPCFFRMLLNVFPPLRFLDHLISVSPPTPSPPFRPFHANTAETTQGPPRSDTRSKQGSFSGSQRCAGMGHIRLPHAKQGSQRSGSIWSVFTEMSFTWT